MIRYKKSMSRILGQVVERDKNWLKNARRRTAKFIKDGTYEEKNSIWSTVKPVFMELQQSKCAYCERRIPAEQDDGAIEWDLEHFRPKGGVDVWRTPAYGAAYGGYYWLAYDLHNYAAACKICNSIRKDTYFPILGARGVVGQSARALMVEEPLLCYPIGDDDVNPEKLIGFNRARADVIIDLFGLNTRENLHDERAHWIATFGNALEKIANLVDEGRNREVVSNFNKPWIPHSNCVKSFVRLWYSDNAIARRVLDECRVRVMRRPGEK